MAVHLLPETLPFAKITTTTAGRTLIVSLKDIGGAYSLNKTTKSSTNQVIPKYDGGYGEMLTDTTSVGHYGQLPELVSVTKITSSSLAGYLANRWLDQHKDPEETLESFTLNVPPRCGGAQVPLSKIFAGDQVLIRERLDLGAFPIGSTRYTYSRNDGEKCELTPAGPPSNIDVKIASKTSRSWA